MKALVTGGGGFLGSALSKALCHKGLEVKSLSRGDYPILETLGVEQIQGDIADKNKVSAIAVSSLDFIAFILVILL